MKLNEWPTLGTKPPKASDTISLGMIGSDLVLRLMRLLLVSTSLKIKTHLQMPE